MGDLNKQLHKLLCDGTIQEYERPEFAKTLGYLEKLGYSEEPLVELHTQYLEEV